MTEKEKKKRIKELRAELKELLSVPKSDWHEAFEAFLRLQTFKYEGVTIQTEVEVGTEPPRTDYIILVQDGDVAFEESSEADVKQVIDSAASSNVDTIKGYYRIMLYLIAAKNTELSALIKRRVEMNKQPLLDIMKDDIDKIVDENVRQVREESDVRLKKEQQETARLKKEKQEADARLKKEQQEADARLKKEQQEADARLKKEQKAADTRLKNASANYIRSLMSSLGVTIEKAMDLLLIPQSERELYISLVKDM